MALILCLLLVGAVIDKSGAASSPEALSGCAVLSAPSGTIVHVSTVAQLQDAVANLQSNTTILIADGDYPLENTLVIRNGVQNVALRGASSNRDAVVIRGHGMSNPDYGNVPHGVLVQTSSNVLIANLTIKDVDYHDIQIQGEQNAQSPHIYNVHLLDSGEQFVKVSTGPGGPYADNGEVACSVIEYTDRARSDYTNGVDALAVSGWVIRDNVFRNIRAPEGSLAGPAVLMWRNSLNTLVERNQFIECDRAIALGLSAPDANSRGGETTYDHQGGIIRNNFVDRAAGSLTGDVGITVNYARHFKVYNNTVVLNDTFPWAIEYRFDVSSGDIRYNLSDGPIQQRDGASATVVGNLTNAQPGWFANAGAGDLHLVAGATQAIDHAATLADVPDDYDGTTRPVNGVPDVGADEYGGTGECLVQFSDVVPGSTFYDYVHCLACRNILSGYGDGTFRPNNPVTRGQLAKIVSNSAGFTDPPGGQMFQDVPSGSTFFQWVNRLASRGYLSGYACGGPGEPCGSGNLPYFRPGASVTRGQTSKIVASAAQLPDPPSGQHTFQDVPVGSTFWAWVEALATSGAINGYPCGGTGEPCGPGNRSYFRVNASVTRGQSAKIVSSTFFPECASYGAH